MAKYSYVVFQLRAHVRHRPNIALPLNDIDGQGTDLFSLLQGQLRKVEGAVEFENNTERAHRIERFGTKERSIMLEGIAGPYGVVGKAVDLDTGDERELMAKESLGLA